MKTIKKTLAQVANDIEQGDAREYCNADFVHITVGQFQDFSAFLSYFNQHYRPLLERIQNGEDISEKDRHLLNFLASDLLEGLKEEEYEDEDGEEIAVVTVTFADAENYQKAQRFFDSSGPSSFWAGDWNDEERTIEFTEGNSPDALEAALREEMTAEGIEGYSFSSHTERV